ncbi:MAG: hypothetical protein D6773_11925, partial [Alphaproteobacteria bacterium]
MGEEDPTQLMERSDAAWMVKGRATLSAFMVASIEASEGVCEGKSRQTTPIATPRLMARESAAFRSKRARSTLTAPPGLGRIAYAVPEAAVCENTDDLEALEETTKAFERD